MSNNSGEKIKWNQIDYRLKDGWYVMKMDGSKFKAFRLPNLDLTSMEKYYDIMVGVVCEVFKKYDFFQACYIIDDEFHFLFHTNDVDKAFCRVSKVVVLPATYVTALVNNQIDEETIQSNKPINYGRLCYDGRLIKLKVKEIVPYFEDLINHGKMFIGNIVVGDGKYFVRMSMDEILEKAVDMKTEIIDSHSIVFGRLVDKYGLEIKMDTLNVDTHKENVLGKIKRYRPIKKLHR